MIQLPQGWEQPKLKEVVQHKKGKKPKELAEKQNNNFLPYVDIKAFEKNIIQKYAHETDGVLAQPEDTLMVWDGARSGLVGKGVKGLIGSTLSRLTPKTENVNRAYLHHYFVSKFSFINTNTKGTGIPHVDPAKLWDLDFPLPPLEDQKRIADKLDSVLAKVEAAQARLDKIPTILKRFRQSVLAAATSGELTKDWRDVNGKALEDWEVKELKEICYSISDGDHQAPPKAESGIPFLVISNISAGYLNFDAVSRWVPEEYYDSLKNIRKPEKGDILYTVTGSFGIPLIVNVDEDFCFQRHIAIIKPDNEIVDTEFLKYFLESPSMYKHATKVATGTAQKTVSLTNLRQFQICLPTKEEQLAISNKVVELFEHAKTVEKQYYASKIRLDKLTQSILARAFRGDLFLPLSESTAIHHGKASSANSSEKTDSTEPNADLVSDMPESSTVDTPKADQVSAKRANDDDLEYEKKSEVLKLLRANKKSSRSAQEIFDSNELNTFETIDNIFIELKKLLKLNLIEQLGNGDNTKFKAK